MKHVRAQVPVDVAVEEPGTGVVGEEPDRDIVAHVTDAHDVTDDGVYKVVRRISSAADDGEGMSMQVNGMLSKESEKGRKWAFNACLNEDWNRAQITHRSTNGTTRNGQFDGLVWLEAVDAA